MMILYKRLSKKINLLIFILLLIFSFKVYADTTGLQISPLHIEEQVSDGTILGPVTINNNTDSDLEIRISACQAAHDQDGTVIIRDGIKSSFLKVKEPIFILRKGERRKVYPEVVLDEVSEGGIYPVLLIDAVPVQQGRESVRTSLRFPILTMLTVKDTGLNRGEVEAVQVFQSDRGNPLNFKVLVANQGNIHRKPLGKVKVYKEGQLETELQLSPENILPDNKRWINAVWKPDELPIGSYHLEGEVLLGDVRLQIPLTDFRIHQPYYLSRHELIINRIELISAAVKEGIDLQLLVSNKGNMNDEFKGQIKIKDSDGREVGSEMISSSLIKPGSSRLLKIHLQADMLNSGAYLLQFLNQAGKEIGRQQINLLEEKPVISLETGEFTISPQTAKGLNTSFLLINKGNIKLQIQGMVEFRDMEGKRVGFLPVKGIELNPQQNFRFNEIWQGELIPGLYQGLLTLIFNGRSLQKETSFIVQP